MSIIVTGASGKQRTLSEGRSGRRSGARSGSRSLPQPQGHRPGGRGLRPAIREGYFDVIDPAFKNLSGRPPLSLGEVLTAHREDLVDAA